MWLFVPCLLLILGYTVLIIWYWRAWMNMETGSSINITVDETQLPSATILVPARNEAANIAACLQSLVAQNYPRHLFEVIVIDDQSEDETSEIVTEYSVRFSFIRLLALPAIENQRSHKKKAIEAGVQQAKGRLILATDADCTQHKDWVMEMAVASLDKNFVAGPVMYHTQPTLLSVFQTLDFLSLQGITGASVNARFHTMCNGANLAYTRWAFEKVNGFAGIDQLPTGDDMLLMHKIYKLDPNGVTWLKKTGAMVKTHGADSWRSFFNQRIRWASKATYYDDKRIFWVLLLVYAVNVMLLITGIAAIFSAKWLWYWLIMVGIKTTAELWFLWPVAGFFQKRVWLWFFPLMQPLHILYTVIAGWLGQFGQYEWKGRVIRREG